MFKFNIEFILDNSTLKVIDHAEHCHGTCVVDFVAYVKDDVSTISTKSKRISLGHHSREYRYNVEKDGRYIYYRVELPYYDVFDGCGAFVDVPYGYFVAENEKGEKIICLNENNFVHLKNNGESVSIKTIDDYFELINSGILSPDNYYSKEFFSIGQLNACVARIQKQYILKHIDDCGTLKCRKGSDSDKANRDFLFIASYILDYLIVEEDFDQAEELLDRLKTCSGSLCNENNINKNCNCNG